jgi:hypothetical protein
MLDSHPIANIFPMMEPQPFEQFQADIKARGLEETVIWLYEGKIIDGRNRHKACEALGVSYETQEYKGNDPIGFVLSRNLHRRQLNESQRAMIGARIATLHQGAPVGNTHKSEAATSVTTGKHKVIKETNLSISQTKESSHQNSGDVKQEEAADWLNVSTMTIKHAKKVQTEADPQVIAAVEHGEFS